ncbi:MAG: type I methionyl aminopeptidase [Candidatus Dormibacteraeota bacterium]|nr:type I methionyl aminopeptidase [Candidatus Dormibacteraeota bacterium]MDQ6898345.1 type I methionyl aminopeptidase [Candidatus Dormibacteraeota bacterium]
MINYKTQHELSLMRQAGLALAAVVEELKAAVQPGVRTREIDKLAQSRIQAAGARPGFLGYQGYPNSICISINDEAVHGIPGPRKVVAGDIVSLDLGLVLDGFWADMGCTVPAGQASAEAQRLIRVTDECLQVALQHAQPGGHLGDISAAVQRHAEQNGFSVIRQFVGHGIGRQMHEAPQVPNFGRPGSGPELKPGMTLAIEPMVNQGAPEVYIKPDGWTVCTSDGLLSSYVEHTVAITAQGPQVLTALDATSSGRIAV